MPTKTSVNGRTVVHKSSGGISTSFPDVCKTPTPGGPVPIPYPNISMSTDTSKGSKSVTVEGNPIMLKDSQFSTSTGDEAGTAGGGVISGKIKGKAAFSNYSFDVKVEGKNVPRAFDPMKHNMGSPNNTHSPSCIQSLNPGGGAGSGGSSGGDDGGSDDDLSRPQNNSENNSDNQNSTDAQAISSSGQPAQKTKDTETQGCPISVTSGEELLEQQDFTMKGPIPLPWLRTYRSSNDRERGSGVGWTHPLSEYLCITDDAIIYYDSEGRQVPFPLFGDLKLCENRSERLHIRKNSDNCITLSASNNPFTLKKQFTKDLATGHFRLDGWSDLSGNRWQCHYEQGRLIRFENSWGSGIKLNYSSKIGETSCSQGPYAQQLLISITPYRYDEEEIRSELDPLVHYLYDDQHDLIEVIDANGHPQHYAYNNHILIKRTLKSGFSYHFEWDRYDRDARCLRNWGDRINGHRTYNYTFEWFPNDKKTRITDTRGGVMAYLYNDRGQVTHTVDAEGGERVKAFDDLGQLVEETDPAGNAERFEYDEKGRVIAYTDACGARRQIEYDPQGRIFRVSDPEGHAWQTFYNEAGLVSARVSPLGEKSEYTYHSNGLLSAFIDAAGNQTQLNWGPTAQLTEAIDHRGSVTRYYHTPMGDLDRVLYPDGNVVQYRYDRMGQLIEATEPDGNKRHYQYNEMGELTRYTDPAGQTTQYEYEGLSQPIKRIDPKGGTLQYLYDGERNLVAFINEHGHAHRFTYDLNENLIEEIGLDGRSQVYEYNPAGHLTQYREYPRFDYEARELEPTTVIDFKRDNMGRLLEQSGDDGLVNQYQYNSNGQLIGAKNAFRDIVFEYDPLGQLITDQQDDHIIRHHYDSIGRRVVSLLPDGKRLQFDYDTDRSSIRVDGELLSLSEYDQIGREIKRYQGKTVDVNEYDKMGRLKQHKVYAAENKGDSIIVQRDYRYDQRTGHLLQIDDLKRGSTHYQYDAVEQLTSVEGLHPEKFVYDPAGNLLEASGEPCEVVDNRLLMQGDRKFEYDLRGNLSLERRGKGGQIKTHYHYNALNQLVEVVKQRGAETRGTYQYQYDPFGRRVAKQDEFGTTHFLWNGDQLLSEDRAHIHKVYVYDPGTFKPLALLQDDQIYYFKLDHLGTPQEMVDKEGELVWSVKYKAFGQTLLKYVEKVNCPFRFQGQYYDEETGLHYNRHRYYDPSVARFISQDPIGLLGGVNLYRYVPNPIGWVDPLGLTAKNDDCDTAVVAKATDLPVVKPGTPEWKNAVDSMSGLGKGKLNVRTETAADAQALLKESRGNMNRYKNYTNDSYKKGYETHNAQNPRELGAGNDLQHLKWKDGKSGGHVYYDKPN